MTSCGKQSTSTAQVDDITINAPIAYSNGWAGNTVTIQISSEVIAENQEHPSYAAIVPQLQYAIDTWNTAIGKIVLVLNTNSYSYLSATGNTLAGCNGISNKLFYTLCDPLKGIFYDRVSSVDVGKDPSQWTSGWAYNTGKSSSILAITVWNGNGGTLTEADIRFNRDSYIFGDATSDGNLYEDESEKTIVDMRSVLLHELGHVLGLGHTPEEEDSIMYPNMNIGPDSSNPSYQSGVTTIKRTLSTCDINRVQHVYSGVTLTTACNVPG